MSRQRRAKWGALLSVAAIAMAASSIGVTQGSFASQTDDAANLITAMPDFRGPTVSPIAIGKSSGNATGFIRTGATYRVYANVTDVGTPPSGTATVLANVSNVTAGQTAVPLVAGSYPAGGVTYNYASAVLTAGALPNGPQTFSVTATDVATNVTLANGSVTIDSTVPAPTDISASGGIAGRPEAGDVLTLTTNDTLDTFSLLANWTGAATTVQVRFVNNGPADRLEVWNSAGTTQVPFGTIVLERKDFTTSTLSFNGSTMTQAAGVITVVLGAPIV
ncbi:MAG TPA: hypothetical protein VER75_02545, partial [Thermoleophilaceae bacterium]|nr:hypothetical protein [Thermoleophilaceae bacterium]